jgi:5-methylcytosine-specific restriction endonuclease McrA
MTLYCTPLCPTTFMFESQTHGIRDSGAENKGARKTSYTDGVAERVKKQPRRRFSLTTRKMVARRQHYCCNICKEILPASDHLDHVLARRYGGPDESWNLQALCGSCHATKTADDNHPAGYEERTGRSKYFFPGPLFHRKPPRPPLSPYDPETF